MAVSSDATRLAEWPDHEDVEGLRLSALNRLVTANIVVGVVWHICAAWFLGLWDGRGWNGPLTLAAFALLAFWLGSRYHRLPAAIAYAVGLAISFPLTAWAHGDPSLLVLLALPVGTTSLLVGTGAGFVAAALIAAAIAAAALWPAVPLVPVAVARLTVILSFSIAVLLWVATYPLRMALHWAWTGYERAQQKTEVLREQRGQLSRTVKDLNAAYHSLELMTAELERARRAAEEARRIKAQFAANISHELRAPLNLIIGFSEMMAMAPQSYGSSLLPAAYRGDVQAIYHSARHLAALVDDVLDLSQIDVGRMGLVREPLALAEVVAEAVKTVGHLFESTGLTLSIAVPQDLPAVPADRARLRQIFINLLTNAARFTDQGGVTITAEASDREVVVAVADTGIGIAEADVAKVFEEFRQLDESTHRCRGGSGLGLAISKELVELHGGRIWLESEVGKGTIFYFSLPLQQRWAIGHLPPEWESWVRLPADGERGKTVVLVHPEPTTVRLFQRYLEGYRVSPAADADMARNLVAQQPVHAVVLPVSSGEEGWLQLQRVRDELSNLPVLVCTLSGGPKTSLPAGIASYLTKPVSRERFLAELEALGDRVRTVLLVDDDPEVMRLLSRMLKLAPRPYRAIKAYGGARALELLHKHRPDAIILDLLMPEVDGYTVLDHMRADPELCEIPAIVVTAKGRDEQAVRAGLVGITRRDGFSVGELMRYLKASLDVLHPVALTRSAPEPSEASPD